MNQKELKQAQEHLSQDPIFKKLIEQHEPPQWKLSQDLLTDLIDSITSQQLSVKAAATIFNRFLDLFPDRKIKLELILQKTDEELRAVGLSFQKIKYIKGIATAVLEKQIDFIALHELSDQQVIDELVKLKGVGKWTAEMILMFSLNRPDVFSVGDLGLRNAINKLYGIDKNDLQAIETLSEKWKPHRSVASHYLWRSLNNVPLQEIEKVQEK